MVRANGEISAAAADPAVQVKGHRQHFSTSDGSASPDGSDSGVRIPGEYYANTDRNGREMTFRFICGSIDKRQKIQAIPKTLIGKQTSSNDFFY